jgi:hypothetical protein
VKLIFLGQGRLTPNIGQEDLTPKLGLSKPNIIDDTPYF